MARNRLSRSRRNKRYSEIDFRLPDALLRLDWSPDQIVGYLRVRGYPTMSHELIYQHIWNDKMTGYTFIGQLDDRTTGSLNVRMSKIMTRSDLPFKTITADNGTEFHGYAQLEKHFYFVNPYHLWERGTNENINGLIRQYLPKRTSMSYVTQKLCNEIAHKIKYAPTQKALV